ncbi:9788_t:CDS:2 [Funneliformis geosporum]|uniref:14849_t:CDS:1 n=1 Tax=Funneliformis geosporum TaxID=1117311 RepID=A0A9W4SW54_9GLOM|nr:9788_t:CDS:2 [Funneliformis geosporum]CAI2183576.1 14849_t:CDS:2 [Funneliformis geosporum]
MAKESICVLEADRPTGVATVKALFESTKSNRTHVTAGVSPNSSEEVRQKLKQIGAQVFVIDDPNHVTFNDVVKLQIILSPERLDAAKLYIDSAVKHRVPFVLLQSVINADERDDYYGKKFKEIEHQLQEYADKECHPVEGGPKAQKEAHIHRHWSILRVGFYDHYLLSFKDCIKKGILDLPIGNGQFAPVAVEDVGKASAHILDKSENFFNKTNTLTGSELFDGKKLAERLSATLHHNLSYKPSEDIEHIKEDHIKKYIKSPIESDGTFHLLSLIKEDKLKFVSPNFIEIEKYTQKTVEQFFKEHKEEFFCEQK